MKKTLFILAVVFSAIYSSSALNAATGELSSEATLTPGTSRTEWKEFLSSGVGTKVFWRFSFPNTSRQAFSVQLKNETGSRVSFSSFTIVGIGTGKNNVWRGILEPNKISTLQGKLISPDPMNQEEKRLIKTRIGGLVQGEGAAGLTEEERLRLDSSAKVKRAKGYNQNLYEKYIQTVGAGTSSSMREELLGKYRDAKQAEDEAKAAAISDSESATLVTPTNPVGGTATSPAFNPDF